MLLNTNPLLGQLIRILYEKSKRARQKKNYNQSHLYLSQSIDIFNSYHHQDLTITQVIKYIHYERLLIELYETLSRQSSLDNDNNLWDRCQNFLKENHSENGKYRFERVFAFLSMIKESLNLVFVFTEELLYSIHCLYSLRLDLFRI